MRRFLPLLALPLMVLVSCKGNLNASVNPFPDSPQEQGDGEATPVTVHEGDPSTVPGFSIQGRFVGIDGEWLGVFEYASSAAAAADQAKVGADGKSIDGNPVVWGGPVHYFRHGTVIVVYVGSNQNILDKLNQSGPQFAGN